MRKNNKQNIEDRAWNRAYDWALKNGYNDPRSYTVEEAVRNCRLIAMAYSMGYVNGRKSKRKP